MLVAFNGKCFELYVSIYLQDLSVFMVNNADDMDKLMTMGNRNRSIGATNMNALSSRSHAIFSITVECSEKTVGNVFPENALS